MGHADRVEGESTHNHDTWLICGAMRGDVVATRVLSLL